MLCRNAYMIDWKPLSFDRFGCTPGAIVIPRPVTARANNSEEEKNEKCKVLVCFYLMY